MAFQPFQGVQGPGSVSDAMAGFGQAAAQAMQMRRQRQLDQEQRDRQQRIDYGQAYMLAHKLAAAGDFEGARNALAPFKTGAQITREEMPGMPKPAGGSAMPDQIEFDPGARVRTQEEITRARAGGADVFGGDADQTATLMDDKDTVDYLAGTEAPAQESPTNPLLALAAKDKERQQNEMAKYQRMVLRGTDPWGQKFAIDPTAARAARIARMDTAMGQSNDPLTKEVWGTLKPWLESTDQEFDVGDMFDLVQQTKKQRTMAAEAETAAKAKAAEAERIYLRNKQDEAERDKRDHEQAKEVAGINARAAQGRQDHVTPEKDQALLVPNLSGGFTKVRTLDMADKLREAKGATDGVGGAIDALRSHVVEFGREGNVWTSKAESDRQALIDDVTSYLTTLFNTGVLNETEYKRYTGKLNTSLMRGGDVTASGLDVMLKGLQSRFTARLNAHARAEAASGGGSAGGKAAPAVPGKKPNPLVRARAHEAARNIFEGKEE